MTSSPSLLLLTLLLIISSFSSFHSLPTTSDEYEYPNDAGDEYEYEDERSEEKYVAKQLDVKITSEKKHVIVAEEDVIRLQCLVENNGESIFDIGSTSFTKNLPKFYQNHQNHQNQQNYQNHQNPVGRKQR